MSETIAVKCLDCGAIIRLDEKDIDDNKSMYGSPEYCVYCGKRSLE
jgi:hypothetical protein